MKSVPIKLDYSQNAYTAVCPDCGELAFMATQEAIIYGPRRESGTSLLLPVTMHAPHKCRDTPGNEELTQAG